MSMSNESAPLRSSTCTMGDLLIMSWNVAGWKATVEYIEAHYGSNVKGQEGKGLAAYLDRMKVDVLCLQEVKLQRDVAFGTANAKGTGTIKAEGGLTARKYGAHLPGWDSFWSFSTSHKGFQGVTTFARKGLTRSANVAPLEDEALDAEGRCVATDHGAFVLFNVYVHAKAEDTETRNLKMRFLDRLQAAMQRVRAKSRCCVLAGDLNIAAAGADVPWKDASIPRSVIESVISGDETGPAAEPANLCELLLRANFAQERKAIVECYTSEGKDRVRVNSLLDALGELPQDPQKDRRQHEIVRLLELTAHTHGESAQNKFVEWLRNLIRGGMVDSFRAARPHARARFTCWNQKLNCRYSNYGRRIDYILYDESLGGSVLVGPELVGDETAKGAKVAATAGGKWNAAPMTGADHSLQAQPMAVHDLQFVPPHTGIVYTPPEASDHVAVSLLLKSGVIPQQTLNLDDTATKACSSRPPRTIHGFFRAAPAAAPVAAPASSYPAPPAAKAQGLLLSFLRKGGAAQENAKRRRTVDASTTDPVVLDGDE